MQASVSVILSLKAERPKTKHQRLTSRKTAERSKEGDKRSKEWDKKHWLLNKYTAISMHSEQMHSDSLHSFCHAFRKNAIDQFVQNLLCFHKSA